MHKVRVWSLGLDNSECGFYSPVSSKWQSRREARCERGRRSASRNSKGLQECKRGQPPWNDVWDFVKKLNVLLIRGLATLLVSTHPGETAARPQGRWRAQACRGLVSHSPACTCPASVSRRLEKPLRRIHTDISLHWREGRRGEQRHTLPSGLCRVVTCGPRELSGEGVSVSCAGGCCAGTRSSKL